MGSGKEIKESLILASGRTAKPKDTVFIPGETEISMRVNGGLA